MKRTRSPFLGATTTCSGPATRPVSFAGGAAGALAWPVSVGGGAEADGLATASVAVAAGQPRPLAVTNKRENRRSRKRIRAIDVQAMHCWMQASYGEPAPEPHPPSPDAAVSVGAQLAVS